MSALQTVEKIKVSELIAQALERLEIRHVLGIIGAGNAHLFDAISHHGYTEIVCVHHEQAVCMAMQTYYRTIGKPLSPYAVTKYVNKLYADVFGKTYDLQSRGLRYFNVFSPGKTRKAPMPPSSPSGLPA